MCDQLQIKISLQRLACLCEPGYIIAQCNYSRYAESKIIVKILYAHSRTSTSIVDNTAYLSPPTTNHNTITIKRLSFIYFS